MTGEDIYKSAELATTSDQRTILTMNDDSEIVGYFESNNLKSITSNKWNFVKTPVIDENNKYTVIDGNEITSIQIKKLVRKN